MSTTKFLTVLFLASLEMSTASASVKETEFKRISEACEVQNMALSLSDSREKAEVCQFAEADTLNMHAYFNIADSLARTSSQILEYRIVNRKQLNESSLIELENLEMKLDYLVAEFRAGGVRHLLE